MQIWAESGKSALPICNYSQILYQFLTFTQNLKRSLTIQHPIRKTASSMLSLNNKHACYLLIVVTSPKKFSKLCSFMQA